MGAYEPVGCGDVTSTHLPDKCDTALMVIIA